MENQLQLEQVKDELEVMKLMYPNSQFTGATIEITAPVWLEDCRAEGMTAQDFVNACSLARRNNTTFPTVGRLVQCHRELKAKAPKEPQKELPRPPMTERQRLSSLENCRKILTMLKHGKKSPECRSMPTA
ncbi:hypothetical protein [Maridesulfovibrio bastinii]|uniref:hypothetical protein n=1 Tax=Maridesulfovibrio bastinii TaxID=47157 RepID=UPI000404852F|nr:hypothetical protein [Maridesulfovibrio bastinii]